MDIQQMVQSILYQPALQFGFAQDRVVKAQDNYQNRLSNILIDTQPNQGG